MNEKKVATIGFEPTQTMSKSSAAVRLSKNDKNHRIGMIVFSSAKPLIFLQDMAEELGDLLYGR